MIFHFGGQISGKGYKFWGTNFMLVHKFPGGVQILGYKSRVGGQISGRVHILGYKFHVGSQISPEGYLFGGGGIKIS